MADETQDFDTVSLDQLDPISLALDQIFAVANVNGKLFKSKLSDLIAFIAPLIPGVSSSNFTPVSGTVLPNNTSAQSQFTFVGAGTFTQTTGGSITTTALLNLLAWNGTTWSLVKAIDTSAFLNKADYIFGGTYATVANANTAITNAIGANGKNNRDGKRVNIGTAGSYIEYTWDGAFDDASLLPLTATGYVSRVIAPVFLTGGSAVKTATTVTIAGLVGFYHGEKQYALVAAGAYTVADLQCLVVSNVNKRLRYDGGANQPPLTPTVKSYNLVTSTDVILAWSGAGSGIQTIWDNIGVPDSKLVQRDINPMLLSGASVSKANDSNYTLVGNVGFFHGNGKYTLITPGSYTLSDVQCLVVSNVNKNIRYDGSQGNGSVLTPTVKLYTLVTDSDVVLAWRGSAGGAKSIWDGFAGGNIVSRVIQPAFFNGSVSKATDSNYTITGNVGFLHGNGKYALVAPGSYTLTDVQCLVVSNVDKNIKYDGSAGNGAILTPTIKLYTLATENDIILAWTGLNGGAKSIWDGFISNSTSILRISTPHIGKAPFAAPFQKIYNQDNLRVLMIGDSIFESSNWWGYGTFPYGQAFTTKIGKDSEQPMQLTDKLLSRKMYDLLMKHSLNTPIYRRFDWGSTFDYTAASGTFGTDTTPTAKFFKETGVFNTWASHQGNGIDSTEYGTYGAIAQIPMTLSDATATYTGSSWYRSGSTEGFTRKSYSANAYVEFTVPAGYSKVRVKVRKTLDGDVLTTTSTNATGVASIDTFYGSVTHNNNSHFTDIEFNITNTAIATTIRLTKSSDTGKCIAYWGAYYYNEPCTIVNNYSYGGTTIELNYDVLPDLLKETYDVVIWELQLLNNIVSSTYAATKTAIQNTCAALLAYGKPIIAVIPQRGSQEGILATDKMWGVAKSILLANNIPFIDLGVIESTVIQQLGRTDGLNYLYSTFGGVHPVGKGIDALGIMFDSLIND